MVGELERDVKTRIRRTKLNKAIIGVLAAVGLIAVALVAPNAVAALGKVGFLPQRRLQAKKALGRMIAAGLIKIETKGSARFVRLTPSGERLAAEMQLGKVVPKKPKSWDGKWRLVIFDIPERRRRIRARLRDTLKLFEFYRLQDSVWGYPYDCEDLILLLKADLHVGKDILYIVADALENDKYLRAHFKLK